MKDIFTFGKGLKSWVYGLMITGVLGVLLSFFLDETAHHSRFWSNFLLNTYYFAGIAITGIFFVAAHQLGYGGWMTSFKKIPIAMGRFLWVGLIFMLIIVASVWFTPESLYSHWAGKHVDPIIIEKRFMLTKVYFTVIVLVFYFLWALFARLLHNKFESIKNWKEYSTAKAIAAVFLLVFGVSSSVLSWYVIMSLDPHWYSTLFGWYNLASYICAGLSMMALILIGLIKAGYLPHVNENHIQDIGKLIFGFSIFWTYLWFSQFMLIWYANVPESTVWFNKRLHIPLFKFLFYITLIINFFIPLLALMRRKAKRTYIRMAFVCILVIIGHYLDFYSMVMVEPMGIAHHGASHEEDHHSSLTNSTMLYAENHSKHATQEVNEYSSSQTDVETNSHSHAEHNENASHDHPSVSKIIEMEEAEEHHEVAKLTNASLGLVELLMFLGFLGIFLFSTFSGLDGKKLEVLHDPYLEESIEHHI